MNTLLVWIGAIAAVSAALRAFVEIPDHASVVVLLGVAASVIWGGCLRAAAPFPIMFGVALITCFASTAFGVIPATVAALDEPPIFGASVVLPAQLLGMLFGATLAPLFLPNETPPPR